MIAISYPFLISVITLIWICLRIFCWSKQKKVFWKRELQLLLVYICIVVVARFTFFPFFKVNGQIQPLILDAAKVLPFRLNFVPLVNLMDYEMLKEMLINVIGNTTMFIPLGIGLPLLWKRFHFAGSI